MIKAIIFDCFGVIITDGLEAVIQQLDKTVPEARAFISETIKLNNSGVIDPSESNQRIAQFLGIPVEKWTSMVYVGEVRNTDMLDWIKVLRKTYKTALLSNVGRGSLYKRFSSEELEQLFDEVVVSGEVGITKPNPDIYLLTAKRLKVSPSSCIFLDDRQTYVQAAVDTGMKGVHYQSFKQSKADINKLLKA
jgi:putative hydrolase of the HAD superfamily